jgi:hypothetical protein
MIYFLLIIIVLANGVFWLLPDGKIAGLVKATDVGLLLVIGGVLWAIRKPKMPIKMRDPISLSIMLLLAFLAVQASIASFNYGQPIFNSIVAIREQYYYLTFFIFLAVLDTEKNITRFLDLCSILAIVVCLIAILDYVLGPSGNIYKHRYSGGVGLQRFGLERAQVAGMDVITVSLIGNIAKITAKKSIDYSFTRSGFAAAFFMGMHFFRMTRSRLVTLAMVIGWMLFKSGQKLLLATIAALVIMLGVAADLYFNTKILIAPFVSTAEVLKDHKGTQNERMRQMETDFITFQKHPIIGSGSAAIRESKAESTNLSAAEASKIARKQDLGYTHWLKAYGVIGIIWLISFYILMWVRMIGCMKRSDNEKSPVPIFMLGYFYFIVISFVTLNHFMLNFRIVFICAIAAMAVNMAMQQIRQPVTQKKKIGMVNEKTGVNIT